MDKAMEFRRVSGFVLVGGGSSRMGEGRDKALLELGGRPMALRACELLKEVGMSATLVGAPERYGHWGLPVLEDPEEGRGPLTGIVTALGQSGTEWNLILACDLPYLEARFLKWLVRTALQEEAWEAVVARTSGGWQPLCALYHRKCLPAFRHVWETPQPKIALAFPSLQVRAVSGEELAEFDFAERMFKNVNTPEEFEEARGFFGGG